VVATHDKTVKRCDVGYINQRGEDLMKKAALIAIGAIVALAPATGEAAKQKGPKACPSNAFCAWTKPNYEGKKVVLKATGVENFAQGFNNRVSSAKNRAGVTTYLYAKRNGEGDLRCFGSGDKIPDLGDSYDFNNEASSSRIPQQSNPCF